MIKTLKDIPKLKGKRVLVRVDFNVPMKDGAVQDDTRMRQTLPTIQYLTDKGARVILVTHVGRPKGKIIEELRVEPIAKHLEKLLNQSVAYRDECVGENVTKAVETMQNGKILFLENCRFHPGEESCSEEFCRELSQLADIYVNDAFAASHRKHASTAGIAEHLPAYAGLLVEREIEFLTPLLDSDHKNLTLIIGGAKVDTKIGVLNTYIGKAGAILLGGALANTFLAAEGYNIGASKYEKEKIETARELMMLAEAKQQKMYLPVDAIVGDTISNQATAIDLPLEDIEGDMKILDIGKKTQVIYAEIIAESKCVVWNGPMGLYEYTPFASGTRAIATALASPNNQLKTYIGGGDTVDAINRCGIKEDEFTFVSTGGGATLEFLEGKKLPGIAALEK